MNLRFDFEQIHTLIPVSRNYRKGLNVIKIEFELETALMQASRASIFEEQTFVTFEIRAACSVV